MEGKVHAVVGPKGSGKTSRLLELLGGEPYASRKMFISDKKISDIASIKKDAEVTLMPYDSGIDAEIETIHREEGIRYFYIDRPGEIGDLLPRLLEVAERCPVEIYLSFRIDSEEDLQELPYLDQLDYEFVG